MCERVGIQGGESALWGFHDEALAQARPVPISGANGWDLYRGACISFGSDEELEQFVADYEGKIFRAPVPNRIILWCYRDEPKAVSQAEWDALDAPVSQRRIYNAPQPVKLVKEHERHTTICYYVRPDFSHK